MEASFPRGGGGNNNAQTKNSNTTSKERGAEKRTRSSTSNQSKDNDFLFGDRSTKKHKSRSSTTSKKHHTSVITPLELGGGGVSAYSKSRGSVIESLSFSKLFPGMKLLGIVRQVTDDFAVVSLPNCLTGFVRRRTKTDPPLTAQVRLYQTLAVAISKTSSDEQKGVTKRRIELSLLPRHVNAGVIDTYNGMLLRGQVMSLEDHGAVVDVGLSGVVAFLPFEQIEGFSGIMTDVDNKSEADDNDSDDEGSSDEESDVDADDQESSTDDDDVPHEQESTSSQAKLRVGMIIDVIVKSKSKQQARPLLTLHLPLASTLAKLIENESDGSKDAKHYTIKALQPGLKVRCVVDGYARNGLLVSFLGYLRGAIDINHLGGLYSGTDGWKEVFYGKGGAVRGVTARVIAVDAASKIIRLSLIPHLLNLCPPPSFPDYVANGEILENTCTVLRIDNGVGVLLALPVPEQETKEDGSDESEDEEDEEEKPKQMAKKKKKKINPLESEEHTRAAATRAIFVHISKVVDEGKNKKSKSKKPQKLELSKLFKVGDKIPKVRVLATAQALVEGWGIGSLQKSFVDADALVSHDDVVTGRIYRGVEVLSIENQGVLVGLGNESSSVKAMCLNMHLSDTQFSTDASHLKQKLTVGKKIDSVRVLSVDSGTKRCFVTMKKSLLRDKKDLICTFDDCKPGRTGCGHVTKVSAQGLYVTFYNNVHGFIPARSLARDAGVQDPRETYHVGSTLVCRVDKLQKRGWGHLLTLSLDVGIEQIHSSKTSYDFSNIVPGKPLQGGKVVELSYGEEIDNTNTPRNFKPGYALVHFKSPANVEFRLYFDQLVDSYDEGTLNNALLNKQAKKLLTVGKKVTNDAIVLTSGSGSKLPSITLKPSLVSAAAATPEDSTSIIFPKKASDLYVGAVCVGYVARIDERFGAFVRFLDGLTGLIPKLKKGCGKQLFQTIRCKVISLDLTGEDRPKITLQQTERTSNANSNSESDKAMNRIKVGEKIEAVEVESLNFRRAIVNVIDEAYVDGRGRVRVHFSMAAPIDSSGDMKKRQKKKKKQASDTKTSAAAPVSEEDDAKEAIPEEHPFSSWSKGGIVRNLTVVGFEIKEGLPFVELSNMENINELKLWTMNQLKPGMTVSGIITSYAPKNGGLWIQVSPGVQGLIPGLEVSTDINRLNNMKSFYPVGSRIKAVVTSTKNEKLNLSVLLQEEFALHPSDFMTEIVKPKKGDTVIGRIHRSMAPIDGPALMLDLRGRFSARCCLTELGEVDDWENMPLGKMVLSEKDLRELENDEVDDEEDTDHGSTTSYDNGLYAECRVLGAAKSNTCLNVSMRQSRLEGDLDDDLAPEVGEIIRAYVKHTDKKGCFVRLSSKLNGRIILKELSEEFIPNPRASFPPGRLVTAKVKNVTSNGGQSRIDLDMRESSLLEDGTLLTIDDIKEGSKLKGIVSRVERYGVFVKLDNSDLTGMSHLSECSDSFIGNLSDVFDPGDRVKVLIIKKAEKKISLGMKASYFVNDADSSDDDGSSSDDDSESADSGGSSDSEMSDELVDAEESPTKGARLSESLVKPVDSSTESSDEEDDESSDESSMNDNEDRALDVADVGFDWDKAAPKRKLSNAVDDPDSDSESSSDEEDSEEESGRHSSRRKAAKRRREEAEVSRREAQLADGTADENPVTSGDFERLLAGDPNSSEIYIRYMAHHLSLSDIDAARAVAERAFQRIEFRQEGEKLNVWTALLALEIKYGSEQSLQNAMDRASNQNNPKQVYLRVCEMLEKDVDKYDLSSSKSKGYEDAVQRAENMYQKMCKKFRSKKTVWIAQMRFLLKLGKHSNAHDILKKSIRSLPNYKHVTVMAKLAQLEFEFGSAERARTIFDGLLEKYSKRLDLVFVHVDKEIKHGGGIKAARAIFQRLINPPVGSEKKPKKYSDKQMKSIFKKWFKVEEDFGDEESQEIVKEEAKAYVERVT